MARTLISFDWALKRLLRQRANFVILEGFLSVLLNRDIVILNLLESESNADDDEQKINRVDILVENDQKERLIIELQYSKEFDYFQRILFATSKHLAETLQKGNPYQDIKKIFSINLIYFDLGDGDDYVYHGKTEFRGIHQNDVLKLSAKQKELFVKDAVYEIFPEYYVIKINNFDGVAKDSLDQWIYYFKNSEVKDEFNARGLAEVKAQLQFDELSEKERHSYRQYEKDLLSQKSTILTARIEGLAEGKIEGLVEGLAKGEYQARLDMARKMKSDGLSEEIIEKYTGLPMATIQAL
jgi:predicted transposase/invertase (TIGR01784 family)